MESFMKEFQHLNIQLEHIKLATDNFHKNKVIGSGGFGTVYKGEVSHSKGKSIVAIKRLDRKFGQGDPEFWKEIMMLSRYTHQNLISLLGFCDKDGEKILVYEHAFNGSLDRHLSSTALTWTQRIKICLDAARGLSFLHDHRGTKQRVLHRDIKSANILLDHNWNAKVADMGLSKIGPANQPHTFLVTNVVGTPGYCDPEYMTTYTLTKESDVYSFGVVLFEVFCGRLCFESRNSQFMVLVPTWKQSYRSKNLEEIIFQHLTQPMNPTSLQIFSDIAFQCLHKSSKKRPTISVIVEKLETALRFQELYDPFSDNALQCLQKSSKKWPTMSAVVEKLKGAVRFQEFRDSIKVPEEYEVILKAAVYPIHYKSMEVLKKVLFKGVLLNGGKTWFSITDNGEHCELISIKECLIDDGGRDYEYKSGYNSRFPVGTLDSFLCRYKTRVRPQFLSPHIIYTVNLVFKYYNKNEIPTKERYIGLEYNLDGDTKTLSSYLVDQREDNWWAAELCQFTSDGTSIDLGIYFGYTCESILVEGIEFRPVEKAQHEVLEDPKVDMQPISDLDIAWEQKLPHDYQDIIKWSEDRVQWTTKKELYSILCTGFFISNGQEWFSLDKNGMKCLMLSARTSCMYDTYLDFTWIGWRSLPESRFGEVLRLDFFVKCIILKGKVSQVISPQTRYASYFVYKLQEANSRTEAPMMVRDKDLGSGDYNWKEGEFWYVYLISPKTPVIRRKVDENIHNPMNRPKVKHLPQQRSDGWMEVQIHEFQTDTTMGVIPSLELKGCPSYRGELMVQGIEFRPVYTQ